MSLKSRVMGERVCHAPNIQDEAGIKGFASIESYKLRMLAPLFPGDSAVMPANTKEDTAEMFRLYAQLGVPHLDPRDVVYLDYDEAISLSQAMYEQREKLAGALAKLKFDVLEPFMYSQEMDRVAAELGLKMRTNARASEIVNDKYISQKELRERGVSTPPGKLVHTVEEAFAFAEELRRGGYEKVSFKLTRAASGMGVFCISPEEIPEYAAKFGEEMKEKGILIDGWITKPKASSPNIQYFVGNTREEDVFISATDQILEDNIHKGNMTTAGLLENERLMGDMVKIRDWSREKGFSGIIGVDFYVAEDGTPYYMETNARVNGSTPGALMVDKLVGNSMGKPWGVQNNIQVPKGSSMHDLMVKLDRQGLTYDPERKVGVLPTNTSAIKKHGKAMVVILGETREEVKDVLNTLYHLGSAA